MPYSGHVVKGTIVLDQEVPLPEGAAVRVEIIAGDKSEPLHPDVVRLTGILPRDLDVREKYVDGMKKKHQ